jgi:uncharacterized membrane protein (UPF0127 family)
MRALKRRTVAPIFVRVRNHTRGTVLCSQAVLARGFGERGRGLLGRKQLSADEGMLFEAGSFQPLMWMHTMFMQFPIDIVFLSGDNVVLKVQPSLKPWRLSSIVLGAHKALEISSGAAATAKTAVGDIISIQEL